jgi:inhibitor of cysteine peptidase
MLVIDQARNNGAAEASVGDTFRVQLSENPTTGYRWHLQSVGYSVLRVIDDSFEASAGGSGVGGIRRWIFVADHLGLMVLKMELRRSWQPQAVDTFSVTIHVKAR